MALRTNPSVTLRSSDRELEQGFDRVKQQALAWVFEGYPVGDYYEAALPGRDAFCMRDVSHQCTGGEVLGLSSHNKNMFLRFAENSAESRDWCSFWEIDRWNRPCPVDYTSDKDFWYNLPANFDVLHACYRMYQWTGDREYISHPVFDNFYAKSMEDYVRCWDRDGDGVPDRNPAEGRRGVAGYTEGTVALRRIQVATDTVAAQARAYNSYAECCRLQGRTELEEIYRHRNNQLRHRLRDEFVSAGQYGAGLDFDGELVPMLENAGEGFLLYWDMVEPSLREGVLNRYVSQLDDFIIEHLSHAPELLWRYGRPNEALRALRQLLSPELFRKEYPEASFCTMGAIATGLMGVRPESAKGQLQTLPQLGGLEWVELAEVPVLGRIVTIRHEGEEQSTLLLRRGEPLQWKASFLGTGKIWNNGVLLETQEEQCPYSGEMYSYTMILLQPGEECTVVLQKEQ